MQEFLSRTSQNQNYIISTQFSIYAKPTFESGARFVWFYTKETSTEEI